MRRPAIAILAALGAVAAAGCTSNGGDDPADPGKNAVVTTDDIQRDKKRILELLKVFESRDLSRMDLACTELRDIGKPLVSDEILRCVDQFGAPATQAAAHERLRFLSKLTRNLQLLELPDGDAWRACFNAMLQLGPEATVRFATVLVLKAQGNPLWCRGMLMDLMAQVPMTQDVVIEALRVKLEDREGVFTRHAIDDNTRLLLATALLGIPSPPTAKIRDLALTGPQETRKALASKLDEYQVEDPVTKRRTTDPWAAGVLVELLAKDESWQVRSAAAESLGRTGDPLHSVPALTMGLKDRDHWVRRNTCIALGQFGAAARDAVGPMIEMLRGLDTELFPNPPGNPAPLAGNPRREVEKNAVAALQIVTGKRFSSAETFIIWWGEQKK